ncbi:MAG TPA: efflux transporter outer membrane subunit [Magnetospirillum sp.]|jgi:NodT family efflux transporter outer membrane factor (OMF) lipoprotein|nr:efflux transporter outer membrane subunit [Magnetospirillum sp.]
MTMRIALAIAIVLAFALGGMLAGCVGPDFERPNPPEVSGYTASQLPAQTASADAPGGEAQRFETGRDIPAEWWALFHSQPLNTLVERALKANADLQAAEAALRAANETATAQSSSFFPTVQGSVSAQRQKITSGNTSPVRDSQGLIYNLYTPQVMVSYTPDVWGGISRQVENAEAQAEAQRFQLEAARLTVTSNVVAAAVQEASLRGQIAATQEIIGLTEESLTILRKQFSLGQIAQADVVAQEAALAQAQQTLPPLRRQLDQQRDLLSALTGGFAAQGLAETFELSSISLPEELPVSLPSTLVEQRPDVRTAEANLHAASAAVGVAIAARLPIVNLTANMGSAAPFLDGKQGLFTPGTGFWTLGSSVTATIFDGFGLMHKQRAAEATFDQARAQYRSTVITAFQNVADVLNALQHDADTFAAAVKAERSAEESLSIVRRQMDLGAIGYLSLLNAQQTALQARIAKVQAQAARLADTAALFQALGGGWWNRNQQFTSGE